MKNTLRKWTAGATMAAVLGLAAMPAMATTYPALEVGSTDVNLVVNSVHVESNEESGQPFISTEGRTMIPLRLVGNALGFATYWQNDGYIHVWNASGTVDVEMQIGSTEYTANGQSGNFERPIEMLNDRTYLPVRDLMQIYGTVEWDNDSRTVFVNFDDSPAANPSDWDCTLRIGDTGTIYIDATNDKSDQSMTLTVPEDVLKGDPDEPAGRYIGTVKEIGDQVYVTVGRAGAMGMNDVYLFGAPANGEDSTMTYIGVFHNGTDFTVANGYIYYTDGTKSGPWTADPHALYFAEVGDSYNRVTFDLDFNVNACTLSVEDGILIATEPDGTRHDVLTVPEAGSVDVAHMKNVLEENETLEGFESSDDTLTFEEIACMPGASVSEE